MSKPRLYAVRPDCLLKLAYWRAARRFIEAWPGEVRVETPRWPYNICSFTRNGWHEYGMFRSLLMEKAAHKYEAGPPVFILGGSLSLGVIPEMLRLHRIGVDVIPVKRLTYEGDDWIPESHYDEVFGRLMSARCRDANVC